MKSHVKESTKYPGEEDGKHDERRKLEEVSLGSPRGLGALLKRPSPGDRFRQPKKSTRAAAYADRYRRLRPRGCRGSGPSRTVALRS